MLHWAATSPVRTLLMLGCAAFAFYFTIAAGQRLIQLYGVHQEQAGLQRELAGLQAREDLLRAERERLVKHQDIESLARQELNLIKPGETAVVVYPATVPGPAGAEPKLETAQPPREPSWLERLFGR